MWQSVINIVKHHRQHEQYYAQAPREQSVLLQRYSRVLRALADRWDEADLPSPVGASLPYQACDDLNDTTAVQLAGVLFIEGEGEPAELSNLKSEVRSTADRYESSAEWLRKAMETSWQATGALVGMAELADLIAEPHRIIINDWQAAELYALAARLLQRAIDVLEGCELTPKAIRDDLGASRSIPGRLYSTAELIDRASDLLCDSATLEADNERRWRQYESRIRDLAAPG